MNNMSKSEREKNAEIWCEGSSELQKLFLSMWDKGLYTAQSCSGIESDINHAHKYPIHKPYIGFAITPENHMAIVNMVSNFTKKDLDKLSVRMNLCTENPEITFGSSDNNLRTLVSVEKSNAWFKDVGAIFERTYGVVNQTDDKDPVAKSLASILKFGVKECSYLDLTRIDGKSKIVYRTTSDHKSNSKLENVNDFELSEIRSLKDLGDLVNLRCSYDQYYRQHGRHIND